MFTNIARGQRINFEPDQLVQECHPDSSYKTIDDEQMTFNELTLMSSLSMQTMSSVHVCLDVHHTLGNPLVSAALPVFGVVCSKRSPQTNHS